jgi:phospholipase/carboxylesterase
MMHRENMITAGCKIQDAQKVLIMLHGRGASAGDILSLATHLQVNGFALLVPQATGNSWYPQSFLAPPEQNEPWLSSALGLISGIVVGIEKQGISKERIYFLGFSQGGCLMLEFAARNAAKYGGFAAFTGGLIGDRIYPENYAGNFAQTPFFIGTGNPDFHVPVERVYATTNILKSMGASVTEKVYENIGHTIIREEIDQANTLIFNS